MLFRPRLIKLPFQTEAEASLLKLIIGGKDDEITTSFRM